MSGREFLADLLLKRGTQESGRGEVVGGDGPRAPGAVEASGRPAGKRPHRVKPRVTDLPRSSCLLVQVLL